MKNKNIFQKIIDNEVKVNLIHKDNYVTAFYDINPKAPLHIILIPNIYIKNMNYINKSNIFFLSKMLFLASKIAKVKNIDKSGYRLVINCNKNAGQEIDYLHMHFLGGKFLGDICCNK